MRTFLDLIGAFIGLVVAATVFLLVGAWFLIPIVVLAGVAWLAGGMIHPPPKPR